ncbi:MAG: hypothetical protein JXB88_01140 [Spirochaetales bacterium]|nr:hypothetical protein [Spirochaetales bacterium]
MKRIWNIFIFLLVFQPCMAEQSNALVSNYIDYFKKGDVETKIQIIETAVKLEDVNMGPLYHVAVNYALDSPDVVKQNPALGGILIISLDEIGKLNYTESRFSVLKLFDVAITSTIQVSALNALKVIGKGDNEIVAGLNRWLDRRNSLFLTLIKPDFYVLDVCLETLGALRNPDSFPFIFTSMILGYSDHISETALNSLYLLEGDLKVHLLGIIDRGTPLNKRAALEFALENEKLPEESKKEIIRSGLKQSLLAGSVTSEEEKIITDMRYTAIRATTKYALGDMTKQVIRHFDIIKELYEKGKETNSHMVEGIDCLGSMGTHEAAVTLSKYLDYVNLCTEKIKVFDEQIVLALINNLEKLDDDVALDSLQYTVFLPYSKNTKKAAQDAANKLLKH